MHVIRKKGVQFGNPQAIRKHRAIRAHLRIDSRESGHLRLRVQLVALRGFSLREFWEVRGFPFCGGKKGLKLPLVVGEGSETPSFLMLRARNKGVSPQEGVSDPFSHRKKRKTPYLPKSPQRNPLSATHEGGEGEFPSITCDICQGIGPRPRS